MFKLISMLTTKPDLVTLLSYSREVRLGSDLLDDGVDEELLRGRRRVLLGAGRRARPRGRPGEETSTLPGQILENT